MHTSEQIRRMSEGELAVLGMNDVAFIKEVIVDGERRCAIHAADGTQMAVLPDRDLAFIVVRQNDLDPVSVH